MEHYGYEETNMVSNSTQISSAMDMAPNGRRAKEAFLTHLHHHHHQPLGNLIPWIHLVDAKF